MRSTLFSVAVLIGLFFASRAAADATLRVCNATGEPAAVAIAVMEPATGGYQSHSEGWFQIDAQACAQVIDSDLDPGTYYYLFAKSATIFWTGYKSNKDIQFCTSFAGRFDYIDRPGNQCTGAGQQMQWFISEPVAGPNWTVELNSP